MGLMICASEMPSNLLEPVIFKNMNHYDNLKLLISTSLLELVS